MKTPLSVINSYAHKTTNCAIPTFFQFLLYVTEAMTSNKRLIGGSEDGEM